MPKAATRRDIAETLIEIHSFRGKKDPRKSYLLVKGRRRGGDFFQVFGAQELKEACLDILGIENTPQNRKVNSNDLARRIWNQEHERH